MTAASVARDYLVAGQGWELVASSSTGDIYRRPDRQLGAARYAYIGSRGAIQLRRGDGVTVLKSIAASEAEATARTLIGKALAR